MLSLKNMPIGVYMKIKFFKGEVISFIISPYFLFIGLVVFQLSSCGTIINPRFVKLNVTEQAKLKPDSLQLANEFYAAYYNDTIAHQVFSVSSDNVKELITISEKKYSLVVFYAAWCGPCRINTPLVEKIQSDFDQQLNVIYISGSDWASNSADTKYLVDKKVRANASLVIDINQYGTKFTPWQRLNTFVKEIKSSDLDIEYGLPTNLLFTNNLELLVDFQEPIKVDSLTAILKMAR